MQFCFISGGGLENLYGFLVRSRILPKFILTVFYSVENRNNLNTRQT